MLLHATNGLLLGQFAFSLVGAHASQAFVHVILEEMATVETILVFLAEHLQDHLQDSVVVAAGRVRFVAAEDAC